MSDVEEKLEPEAEEEPDRPEEVHSGEAEQEIGEIEDGEEGLEPELSDVAAHGDQEPVADEAEEFESRSSATPTQDDTASPIEGHPPQPRLTDGLVSTLAVVMDEVPLAGAATSDCPDAPQPNVAGSSLEVDNVSDGDLDEDGGGENELAPEVSPPHRQSLELY